MSGTVRISRTESLLQLGEGVHQPPLQLPVSPIVIPSLAAIARQYDRYRFVKFDVHYRSADQSRKGAVLAGFVALAGSTPVITPNGYWGISRAVGPTLRHPRALLNALQWYGMNKNSYPSVLSLEADSDGDVPFGEVWVNYIIVLSGFKSGGSLPPPPQPSSYLIKPQQIGEIALCMQELILSAKPDSSKAIEYNDHFEHTVYKPLKAVVMRHEGQANASKTFKIVKTDYSEPFDYSTYTQTNNSSLGYISNISYKFDQAPVPAPNGDREFGVVLTLSMPDYPDWALNSPGRLLLSTRLTLLSTNGGKLFSLSDNYVQPGSFEVVNPRFKQPNTLYTKAVSQHYSRQYDVAYDGLITNIQGDIQVAFYARTKYADLPWQMYIGLNTSCTLNVIGTKARVA